MLRRERAQGTRVWGVALFASGVFVVAAPWLAPGIDVRTSLRLIDHVVPGLIVCGGGGYLLTGRRGVGSLVAMGVAALAGLFTSVAHVGLVLDPSWAGPRDVAIHAAGGPVAVLIGGMGFVVSLASAGPTD